MAVRHAVRDIDASLRELRAVLRPGGRLVLGEAVKPQPDAPVPIELVFQLMPEFRGFLWHGDWIAALERAGFADVRVVPDMGRVADVYPSYSLAALSSERPA